ncbi:MAG: glycosyltransferase family 2 protein [Planctomycetota bacterium]|nr:MAG: glycosyltransferase family 2 protein [Planctomycetota bacterium]
MGRTASPLRKPIGRPPEAAGDESVSESAANATLPASVRDETYVVIAAYNEASCIESVVTELRSAYPHVVVVDDGSTDGTFEAARRAAPYALRHLINRGQGAALQTGITFALQRGARYIVTFDADGQHRVEDIAALLEPIVRGECEITLGSRFLGDPSAMPASRRRLLYLAVWFTRIVNRVPVTDAHNGLRAFSRRAAERIDITLDRMAHASELLDQIRHSGLAFREVPVTVRYTDYSLRKGQTSRNALHIAVQYILGRVLQ